MIAKIDIQIINREPSALNPNPSELKVNVRGTTNDIEKLHKIFVNSLETLRRLEENRP
jgi:hypothetical protein